MVLTARNCLKLYREDYSLSRSTGEGWGEGDDLKARSDSRNPTVPH